MSLSPNDQIKRRVLRTFPTFVSDVDPDQLCDHLIANQIITTERWDRIRKQKTQQQRCRELLLHLDSIKNPLTFLVVRDALKTICPHVYEQIEHQTDTETGGDNEISAVQNDQLGLQRSISSLQEQVEKLEQERDEAGRLLNEYQERLQVAEAQSQERLEQMNAFKDSLQALEVQLQSGKLGETKNDSQVVTKERNGDIAAIVLQSKDSFQISSVNKVFCIAKLDQTMYILCQHSATSSYAIRVFEDSNGYRFVKEISLSEIESEVWSLVSCDKTNSVFFTGGKHIIWVVRASELSTVDYPVKEWLRVDKKYFRMSKSQDGHLMVFSDAFGYPKVEIYDVSNASCIRICRFSIDTIDGFRWRVMEKPNGNFMVYQSSRDLKGLWVNAELDRDGKVISPFDLSKSRSHKLNVDSELCFDCREDRLFVFNYSHSGVDLFDANSLNFIATLLDPLE